MKTADLITSYLNNEMTPEQERQFLLSVAASDSMRLSLKSHVMLDRIVTNQVQHAHVPELLRNAIFAQMAASMPAGTPGVGSAHSSYPSSSDGMKSGWRFFEGRTSWFGRGALVALFTFAGFAAGYLAHPEIEEKPAASIHAAPSQTMQRSDDFAPAPSLPASPAVTEMQTSEAAVAETIPSQASYQSGEQTRSSGALRSGGGPGTQADVRTHEAASRSVSSGQQTSTVLPSSPLDPSNRVRRNPTFMPKPEEGRTLGDSTSRAGNQPANVDVRATIRTSSDSNRDSHDRNP